MVKVSGNFDFGAIKRRRARVRQRDGKSLVEQLTEISPDLAKLNVGDVDRIEIPKGWTSPSGATSYRSFVQTVTSRLTNASAMGGELQGHTYEIVGDPEEGDNGVLYVRRGPNAAKPKVMGRRGASKATATPAKATAKA